MGRLDRTGWPDDRDRADAPRRTIDGRPIGVDVAIAQRAISWSGGHAVLERQALRDDQYHRFCSDRHAVFFGYDLQSEMTDIRIDGEPFAPRSLREAHLIVLPAGREISGIPQGGRGESACLAILLDPAFMLNAADAAHVRGVELEPAMLEGDSLSWQLAQAIREECISGSKDGAVYVETAATMLSLHLLRHHSNLDRLRIPAVRGGLSQAQLRTVTEYMMSHLGQDIGLGTLAGLVGLSESHFSRAFKVSTGRAPLQWRMDRRLDRAQELMLRSQMPLAELALACGFANQSHFTKAFRDALGVSPAAWRRKRLS